MPLADFYVLPDAEPESRTAFLCRLADKVLGRGLNVFIRVSGETEAQRLDQLLWDYRADAFIPHGIINQTPTAPVQIGWGEQLPTHRDVYINLALEAAEETLEFERILEIVIQQPDILAATRKNFALYKKNGITPSMHDMRRRNAS
ncbi:DNA polymerase III subunit chi [Amphritea sp. 1_MG-2023]|uniref:DNA polymerase III subunit chi n=1 Tax=Amphritea sp. 1_MG-2023 TaxID=3062670 RepID=UPI0026E32FB1|nr:DNA polymerase III subunit chi [Amphritea sp. 1_MG-2023]MDO6562709.1 DNA polymerase III subunit chi [Amphritea sp. 1_MG-2023]